MPRVKQRFSYTKWQNVLAPWASESNFFKPTFGESDGTLALKTATLTFASKAVFKSSVCFANGYCEHLFFSFQATQREADLFKRNQKIPIGPCTMPVNHVDLMLKEKPKGG